MSKLTQLVDRRKARVRRSLRSNGGTRPRLSVHRSSKNI
jgi:ribosomal protein L18